MLRSLIPLAILASLVLASEVSRAAPPGETCFGAYESAQSSQKSGRVVRAKSELELCIGSCPAALAADCKRWLAEVDARVAELTITTVDRGGLWIGGARVEVDGLIREAGGPLQLDPGPHTIRVEASGKAPIERKIQLDPGAKKTEAITLTPLVAMESPPPVGRASSSVAPFVIGGIGLGALAGGGVLSLVGWLDESSMRKTCAPAAGGPGCPASRIDRVRGEWIGGGILAGAGAVALPTAVVLLATRPPRRRDGAQLEVVIEANSPGFSLRSSF